MRGQEISLENRNKMISLRSEGHSLPEISNLTGIPKTTIFRYIQNVKILPEYQEKWAGKRGGSRKKKKRLEELALEKGKEVVGVLLMKEKILYMAALYWAEGSQNDFGLSNTDPGLIRLFITFLREVYAISNDRLRIGVRIYEDLDREACLNFWSEVVGIKKEKFVNIDVLTGKKRGKLQYGMRRIRVSKGGDYLKEIAGINKAMVLSSSS
jgi:hypothetical protein